MADTNHVTEEAAAARKRVHVVGQNTLIICANCGHKEDVPIITGPGGSLWTKVPDDYRCPVCGATQEGE